MFHYPPKALPEVEHPFVFSVVFPWILQGFSLSVADSQHFSVLFFPDLKAFET